MGWVIALLVVIIVLMVARFLIDHWFDDQLRRDDREFQRGQLAHIQEQLGAILRELRGRGER
jgi:hypothetical protein